MNYEEEVTLDDYIELVWLRHGTRPRVDNSRRRRRKEDKDEEVPSVLNESSMAE